MNLSYLERPFTSQGSRRHMSGLCNRRGIRPTGFAGVVTALSIVASITAVTLWIPSAAGQSATPAPAAPVDVTAPLRPEVVTPTPLVRVPPDYPQSALARGTTGSVTLQFTVTASGTVKDVIVVRSEPPGVFDDAAREAVEQWRYSPQPADRPGVETFLTFSLGDSRPPAVPSPTRSQLPSRLPEDVPAQMRVGSPASTLAQIQTLQRYLTPLFARQLEYCDETVSRRDQSPDVRDFCRNLEDSPSLATIQQNPPQPASSLGEAIWIQIVIPMALFEPDNPIRQRLHSALELDDQAAEALASRAQAAVDAERNHWGGLEQERLCQQPQSFATGEAFYGVVDEIHRNRIPEQQRLAGELIMALDPALAERIVLFSEQMGAFPFLRPAFPLPLREWSNRRLATAKAALCP